MPRKTQPSKASKSKKQAAKTPVADRTSDAPPPTTIKLKITLKPTPKVPQEPPEDGPSGPSAETPVRNLVVDGSAYSPSSPPKPVKALRPPPASHKGSVLSKRA